MSLLFPESCSICEVSPDSESNHDLGLCVICGENLCEGCRYTLPFGDIICPHLHDYELCPSDESVS